MPGPTQAEAYAVLAAHEQGLWSVDLLPDAVTHDLEVLVAAVRQQPGGFALVDVADEFFVVVRVQHGRVRLLLSDVTASAEWDLATQVVDHLGIDIPRAAALERVVPAGDLGFLKIVGRLLTGNPRARAEEAQVREFLEPYGEWKGLAGVHLMHAAARGLTPARWSPGPGPGPAGTRWSAARALPARAA